MINKILPSLFLCAFMSAAHAAPVVLLRDNFNASTPNTFDLNVDLARQTGTLAPVQYSMAGGPGHYGHQLQNANAVDQLLLADFGASTSSPNFNFNGANSVGGLVISFDLDSVPDVYNGDPSNWGCVNFGASQADQLVNVNGAVPHFGILFRKTGTIQAFDGGAAVSPDPEPVYTTSPGGFHHIEIVITDTDRNPFDGVGNTIIEVFADNKPLPVWSYTKVGGYANNYINFQGSFRSHFDNITVSRLPEDRTPTIVNPSFEADTFVTWPGYVSQAGNGPITGWASAGGAGLNPVAPFGGGDRPFADNGTVPDGRQVVFIQEDSALRQVISGFTVGATYQIRYYENARNCCGGAPALSVTMGGQTIVASHQVAPVGGSNPYREVTSDPFTATSTAMELAFVKTNPGGDTTVLIDQVSVVLPNTPPSITLQPQDQEVGLGETAQFVVAASGSFPLTYQWYYENIELIGETNPTLSVPADFADVAGRYFAIVRNSAGSATSATATLTVRASVPGLFNTGVDDNKVALPDGFVDSHYKLVVNADGPSTDAIVENSAAFPIVNGPWVANNASGKWIGPRFDTAGAAGLASGGGIYLYELQFDLTGLDHSAVVITGGWAVDNEGLSIRVNGQPTGLQNLSGFVGLTPFRLTSANAAFQPGLNTLAFEVRNVDAVAGYTGLRVANLRGLAPLPATPPTIRVHPQSQLAGVGESVTLTASAEGSSPLRYQWQLNGADIAGATSPALTIATVARSDAGIYRVQVTNDYGVATSQEAVLTVRDPVPGVFNTGVDDFHDALPDGVVDLHYKILQNPDSASADALVEDSTVFPLVAGPWVANTAQSKWIGPRTETSAAAGGDYLYRTTFDATGFDPASLIVTGLWSTDNEGLDILINGVSTGHRNLAQFVAYTSFAISNGIIAGVNTLDFKLNNAAAGYTGLRVDRLRVLGNPLPPNTPPFIITQPANQTSAYGSFVTFNVVANGSAPMNYQWFFGPDILPGETGPSLTVEFLFPDQVGAYSVQISNGAGSITSASALLSGPNEAPFFTQGPDVRVEEDSGPQVIANWAQNISAGPPSEAGQSLQFIVTVGDPSLFSEPPSIDASTGTLRFTAAPNAFGVTTVTVLLKDDGGTAFGGADTSSPHTFGIVVTAVNDCPTAISQTVSLAEGGSASITLAGTDVEGQSLTYLISLPPAHGTLTGSGADVIYAPAANYCGPDSFTFTVSDGTCVSPPGVVTIQMVCLNDPPTPAATVEPFFASDGPNSFTVVSINNSNATVILDASGSSDPDGDALSFQWFKDGEAAPFATTAVATGVLDVGDHDILLVVQDGNGGAASLQIQVTVLTIGEAVEILINLVDTTDLARQNKRPLLATLKSAAAAFDRGLPHTGRNTLNAFVNKVRAQIGKSNPAAAAAFTEAAEKLIEAASQD